MLEPQRDLIDRIRICYGVDRGTFERELFEVIRRYADFVHLVPATGDNYFNAPAGLLRLGLEVGFFSLQGTDGHIFSGRSTISARRHLEPRWRYATFVAGLCCELHRTVSHLTVTDERGTEWPSYLMPLSPWLTRQGTARYFTQWTPHAQEIRALGVFAVSHVVPAEVLQHLATDNSVVVPHMMASISGMPISRDHNILDQLVRRALALVIDRDLRAGDVGRETRRGNHVARYLVDALRRLVRENPAWRPNSEKSRVWFGADGLFVVWPNGAVDIQKLLQAGRLSGIPTDPDAILRALSDAGVCEAHDADGKTWDICPPGTKAALGAVKLTSPESIFSDPVPDPLPVSLRAGAGAAEPTIEALAAVVTETEHPPQLRLDLGTPVDTHDGGESVSPELRLNAPMRLNPAVRETVARIIDTLNRGGPDVAACTTAAGVFIPLVELERRNLEPSLVLRALCDANMLVPPAGRGSLAVTRDFGGQQRSGLILHPRFVAGLDLANFRLPD